MYVFISIFNLQYISYKQQHASFLNLCYQLVVTTFRDSLQTWLINDIIIRNYGDINKNM